MIDLSFKEITARLKEAELPCADLVIGIGTGGVVPASLVAFRLGCDLKIMTIQFRDDSNNPQYDEPVVLMKPDQDSLQGKQIILVDDVSVTGKTLAMALKQLEGCNVKTFTLKGKADFVLFPDINECVRWPWKIWEGR